MRAEHFLEEARKASDPEKQYYTILSKYEQGHLDSAQLKNLATESIVFQKKNCLES